MHSYRERLYAPAAWWVAGALTLFTFGAIVWTGFDLWITLAVFGTLFLLEAAFLLNWGRAKIEVCGGELTAGTPARARRRTPRRRRPQRQPDRTQTSATLPLGDVGAVHQLDESQFRAMRGPRADPRAYLLIRPYLKHAVYIEVTSPASPWPYWLVATRRPAELAAAIELSRPVPRAGGMAMG
jgi:Protein of unknown function (DUF3093)